jgi:hypothetical protein
MKFTPAFSYCIFLFDLNRINFVSFVVYELMNSQIRMFSDSGKDTTVKRNRTEFKNVIHLFTSCIV